MIEGANLKEQMISDLTELVAIPSITDDRVQTQNALKWVLDKADSLGLKGHAVCDGQIGEIEVGHGDETIAVLVHLDVVPPGKAENWISDPFVLTRRGGKLYGRSAQDDKGPLIASLYAMRSLLDQEASISRTVRMIIGTREETDWADIHQYIAEKPLPDYGFTPDGDFPVCNIEKGILELDLFIPYTPGGENGWYLTYVDSGDMNNTVPGEAHAEITLFQDGKSIETKRISANGKAIHSGEPELGDNAIYHLIDEIESIGLAESTARDALMMLRDEFSDIEGTPLGIQNESEYYDGEHVGKSTISVNRLEIKGDELWFHADIRYTYGTDPDKLQRALQKVIDRLGGRISRSIDLPPAFVKSDQPFIHILREVYREATGTDPGCISSTGGTYAQAMPNIVTWGHTFPGTHDTCHEENEFIDEDLLPKLYSMYAEALHRLAVR